MALCVVCLSVADVLWLNGKSWGSAMVPLDRVLATFFRLSTVINNRVSICSVLAAIFN